jgi:two-component system, OmpR family, sensor histidine kinase CiaH
MPDGAVPANAAEPVVPPARTDEPDGRLVRRVRWQLIAWSAGSTFVVLLVLGATIYAAVAATLASASENLLRDRANLLVGSTATVPVDGALVTGTAGTVVVGADAAQPGFAIEGPYSGTLAVVVPVEGTINLVSPPAAGGAAPVTTATGPAGTGFAAIPGSERPGGTAGPVDPPDPVGYAAAEAGQTSMRETSYRGSPVRVLSVPLPAIAPGVPAGVVQVVGDRTAELRTLGVLLVVLLGGGLVALAIAALAGSLYATRALVPIRASLRRQREFAADTSHELRTPLAVIRAGVARVRQQPDARVADIAPALEAVDAEAVRLGTIVDDLLALARTDAGPADLDLRPVDLAEVAASALTALEPLALKRGVRLTLDVEPAVVIGDADRLRRLVTVLADNAIRHGREGGNVAVIVRQGSLVVEDDGPGVPAAERDRVFERFFRGEGAAPGGSGLGLAIADWIVERHGGQIRVGSAASGGARFEISLPISPPPAGFMTSS